MKERPILFSAPMVRAILAGNKTVTRRVVKPFGADHLFQFRGMTAAAGTDEPTGEWAWCGSPSVVDRCIRCPYGKPGDRLWVREAHRLTACTCEEACRGPGQVYYAADCSGYQAVAFERLRPSIHMPRWASRITLEITGVRVERLKDMEGHAPYPVESDALAEGVHRIHHGDGDYYYSAFRNEPHPKNWCDPTDAFRELWESINGAGSWEANPWVWVVEFKRIPKEQAA